VKFQLNQGVNIVFVIIFKFAVMFLIVLKF